MSDFLPDLKMTHEELKNEIQIGLDELDRGEVVDGPEYFDRLFNRLRPENETDSTSDDALIKKDDGPAAVP
jgi:hypothetical protein